MWTGLLPSAPLPSPSPPPATGLASDSSLVGGERRNHRRQVGAIWPLGNGKTLSGSFPRGAPLMTLQRSSSENLPLHVQLVTAICPPAGHFNSSYWQTWDSCRLPVNLLQANFGWLLPVWPTADLWEEHTWVPQSVKLMVASIQPPQSLFSGTWQHLLYFPPRASGSKVSLQGTLVMSPRNLLPCSTHVLRQHQDPRYHLIGVR